MKKRIFTLNEPNAPRINPALAKEIGLNESLILLQIEYWISISDNERDGKWWTYQSVRDMQEKSFPFWSISTINRAVNKLIDEGYIIEGNFNKKKYDKTRWFALNFEKLNELESISINGDDTGVFHNDTRSNHNDTRSNQNDTTIPENTTENTTKEKVDYQEIVDLYHSKCTSLPKIMKLSTSRRKAIKARLNDLGMDGLITLFEKAEASDFLSGRSGVWKNCNFDWLLKESNSLKVLEGNYDNTKGQATSNNSNDNNYYGDFEFQIGEGRLTEDGVIVKND